MQRRQHQAAADDVPTLTEAIGDDGIPLLLNIDIPAPLLEEPVAAPPQPELHPSPARSDGSERDILVRELARRVEQRLIHELPQIIEATVRDFLAEQNIDEDILPHA
jgi:hypothetical protein